MSRFLPVAGLCAAAALLSAPAHAASFGTLTFDTPTGTVLSNENIPVYVTFTLGADSPVLATDGSSIVTSGVTAEEIAAVHWHDDDNTFFDPALTQVQLNHSFECSGTFTTVCGDGPPYDFTFNPDPDTSFDRFNVNMAPGDTMSWLFGTFSPTGGNAPAGNYTFYNANFLISLYYQDAEGHDHFGSINLGSTCPGQNDACAFTRQVLAAPSTGGAVPEPATWAMMIAGFSGAGAMLRRRRAATTA